MTSRHAVHLGAVLMLLVSLPFLSHAQTAAPDQTATAQQSVLSRTLSLGSAGPDVSVLQEFLRDHGYFTYPAITGYFGPVTQAAVIAFQQDNGIDPIGIVGPLTRAKIAQLSGLGTAVPTSAATSTLVWPIYGNGARHHGSTTATRSYTIGGTVNGLSGAGLTLQDNGGDNLSVSENGAFTFDTSIASGSAYNVTVFTNPGSPSQTCIVTNGSGTVARANVTNISVTCSTDTYTVIPSGDSHESISPSTPQGVEDGSTLSFTVAASSGYTLSPTVGGTCAAGSWSGSTYTTGPITSNCTVSFSASAITYALSVIKTGPGDGNIMSTPAGISCGATCSALYSAGTMVTLTAFATGEAFFDGWSGGGCSGMETCVVTMNAATAVTALFEILEPS